MKVAPDFADRMYKELSVYLGKLFGEELSLSEKLALRRQTKFVVGNVTEHPLGQPNPRKEITLLFLQQYGISHQDFDNDNFKYHPNFIEYIRRQRERAIMP